MAATISRNKVRFKRTTLLVVVSGAANRSARIKQCKRIKVANVAPVCTFEQTTSRRVDTVPTE
jgi:hypothetical protein